MDKIVGGNPPKPRTIAETGLSANFIADLALKQIYIQGLATGQVLAQALKLPLENVLDETFEALRRDGLIEVPSAEGTDPNTYRYGLTQEGRLRARELMDLCQYTGPAPVSLSAYANMVHAQSLAGQGMPPDDLRRALSHLVLPEEILNNLGPAVNAGKALFLFGNTGNGKTSIGLGIGAMLPGEIWIPYAVAFDGQVIKVFDAVVHRVIEEVTPSDGSASRRGLLSRLLVEKSADGRWIPHRELLDARWLLIHRPLVVGGGEMTLRDFELVFDPTVKYYEAPHQMKANGGAFLVDDLGRQKVSARDILNRWIVPLEKRVDYLTPHLGNRIEVPFDALLMFATNLEPRDVSDETFLRRLRYKIHITDPTWDAFAEIFRREAAKRNLAFSEKGFNHLVEQYYRRPQREPRGVHPRDILDELLDIARFRGTPPTLSKELLDLACQAYFLKEENREPVG